MKKILVIMDGLEFLVDAKYSELRVELLGLRPLIKQAMLINIRYHSFAASRGSADARNLEEALKVVTRALEPFKIRFNAIGMPFTPVDAREEAHRNGWQFQEFVVD